MSIESKTVRPRAERQADDCNVICPYCGHSYQAEADEYNETEHEETCSECGCVYLAYDEFSVTHHTRPMPEAKDLP